MASVKFSASTHTELIGEEGPARFSVKMNLDPTPFYLPCVGTPKNAKREGCLLILGLSNKRSRNSDRRKYPSASAWSRTSRKICQNSDAQPSGYGISQSDWDMLLMRGLAGLPHVSFSEMNSPILFANQVSALCTSAVFPSFPLEAGVSLQIGLLWRLGCVP